MATTIHLVNSVAEVYLAADLALELGRHERHPLQAGARQALADELASGIATGDTAVLLAIHGSDEGTHAPVGCVVVKRVVDGVLGLRFEVGQYFVEPAFRGCGVGRRLARAATEVIFAMSNGADAAVRMVTTTGALHPFYEQLGFKTVGRINEARVSDMWHALREPGTEV